MEQLYPQKDHEPDVEDRLENQPQAPQLPAALAGHSLPESADKRRRTLLPLLFVIVLILILVLVFLTLPPVFQQRYTQLNTLRFANGWCSALPTSVGVHISPASGQMLYQLHFAGDIPLHEDRFYIYFYDQYIEPEFLDLERYNFESSQWDFTIEPRWVNSHSNWQSQSAWRVDYAC